MLSSVRQFLTSNSNFLAIARNNTKSWSEYVLLSKYDTNSFPEQARGLGDRTKDDTKPKLLYLETLRRERCRTLPT
ncbi:MAG: hypothetical protein RMX96_04735 [Nostoc sp. ChiSLP02]|nr:hypothetical protein [Nostoc sp. DedSLP05]MDZ8102834.1 hypothetical protein [Nostoc sp. DedSLP01]MDZ8184155.1 hypothetical protein [Nostoc sp. ChiSLP02]